MLILPKSPHYCFRAIRSLDTGPHFTNIDTYKADPSQAAELFSFKFLPTIAVSEGGTPSTMRNQGRCDLATTESSATNIKKYFASRQKWLSNLMTARLPVDLNRY